MNGSPASARLHCRHAARTRRSAAACGLLLLVCAGTAAGSPGVAQPSFAVSGAYRSNSGYSVGGGEASNQLSLALGMPMTWARGRHEVALSPSLSLRRDRGTTARDDRDLGIGGSLRREGERLSLGAGASWNEVSLLSPDAPDIGPDRTEGAQRSTRASLEARWFASEVSAVSLVARSQRTRFDADESAGLRGSDDLVVSGNYSRALGPRVRLIGGVSRSRFTAEGTPSGSTATSAQAGLDLTLGPLWSASASYGRSRVERAGGATVPSTVYDVSLARRAELGSLSLAASQSLQSSAFGAVARQRNWTVGWSQPFSPRLGGGVTARRQDSVDVVAGFDLQRIRTEEIAGSLSYGLSELWTLGGSAGWSRQSALPTPLLPETRTASSWSASLSLSRRIGTLRIPGFLP